MKIAHLALPAFLLLLLGGNPIIANAQKDKDAKAAAVKNMVDSQRYVFYAQYASPMSGRQRYLNTDYTVFVSKDTVQSDLPYFGRAYSAPIGTSEGGIKFTSTNFDYSAKPRKKGGWDILIKPKDGTGVQQMVMTVFENGSASLQVASNNRQPISFTGIVKRKKA